MGCCCSGHEEAKRTNLAPPQFGKDVNVTLTKQWGWDADFDVYDEDQPDEKGKPQIWMLIDAVGGVFDSAYDYYLKYRAAGMEESCVLGCANLKKEHDYLWYNVTSARQEYGVSHWDTHNERNRRWTDKAVSAKWIIARRARLFSDKEQTNLIGRLQISGVGTYWRHVHIEEWEQRVEYEENEGDDEHPCWVTRVRWEHRSSRSDESDTDVHHFTYSMNAYQTDFAIQYNETKSGSWLKADKLHFQATNTQGLPLFSVESDGAKTATVRTHSNSDPVNAILAAFAISVKLEPKAFFKVCSEYTHSEISVDSFNGQYGGFGPTDAEFQSMFPTQGIKQPAAGFAFGVAVEALPMAIPIIEPTIIPMAMPVVSHARSTQQSSTRLCLASDCDSVCHCLATMVRAL